MNLTSSEIERIAESEYVTHIDYIDLDAVDEVQEEGYNPNPVTDEQKKTYNEKIDPDELVPMLEKAEEGEKFTVWVWVVDRAKDEAICAQVRSRMIADGSWENHTNPEYDNWDDEDDSTILEFEDEDKIQEETTKKMKNNKKKNKIEEDDVITDETYSKTDKKKGKHTKRGGFFSKFKK